MPRSGCCHGCAQLASRFTAQPKQATYAPNADAHADAPYHFNGYCPAESLHLRMHPAPMVAVAYTRRAAEFDTPFMSDYLARLKLEARRYGIAQAADGVSNRKIP